MRNTRSRSIVLSFLTFLFLFGIGLFVFKFITSANLWVLSPINKHLSGNGIEQLGDITDRNNVVLAHSENNKRKYHNDEETRRALLHTVGDNDDHISSSVQALYKDVLYGYNLIFGVTTPTIFSQNKNIQITLDSELCKTALSSLGTNKGAVCVYNYKTGEILCMVSSPTYDPYHPEVVEKDTTNKYDGAYINRVIHSSFTPGSVFKIITSASGIANFNDIDKKEYFCNQTELVDNKKITCLGRHGNTAIKNAMMKSCNIYFADLAIELGKTKMTATANSMGFNKSFKFNRIETKSSFYNVDDANNYDLGWSGVGQYSNLLNPLHSTILMGAIANSGTAVIPHFIKNSSFNESIEKNIFQNNNITEKLIDENIANKLKELMRYNVTASYGDNMFPNLNVCAKTGTAEVGENKEPHGWMVGFSTNENTPLAFSVIVENAGYGYKTAGPIASTVLNLAAKRLKSQI